MVHGPVSSHRLNSLRPMNTLLTLRRSVLYVAVLFGLSAALAPDLAANALGGHRKLNNVAAPGVVYYTPDTLADPHQKDYRIPIYLANPLAQTVCDPNSLTITLTFNGTLFHPRSVSRGTIVNRTLSGDMLSVEISLAGTAPVAEGLLTELVGDVLLGAEQSTYLQLAVKCAGVPVTDSIYNGSIYEGPGFCENGSDRLLVYTTGLRINKIAPNPAGRQVTVNVTTIEENEETWLELFATDGRRVFATMWMPRGSRAADMERTIVLPADLPNGRYHLVLRSPLRIDTQSLLISN